MLIKSPIEPNAIYTRQETAHLLGISLSSLKQLIRTGQLKVSQPLGMRRVLIRGNGILEMLERSEKTFDGSISAPTFAWQTIGSRANPIRPKQEPLRAAVALPKKAARASGGANR